MYKIIIIDDEPIITRGLKIIIERSNLNCEIIGIAYNGRDGLDLAKKLNPDIIVTDICMPDINGLEMIAEFRKLNSNYEFIILSGFLEFEYAKKAMHLEVKHFITKPVEESELYKAISDCILRITDKKQKMEKKQILEESFKKNKSNLANYILRDILIGAEETQVFMDDFLPTNFFPKGSKQFICILFQFSQDKKISLAEKYDYISKVILDKFKDFLFVKNVLYSPNKIAVIIANINPIIFKKLKQDTK